MKGTTETGNTLAIISIFLLHVPVGRLSVERDVHNVQPLQASHDESDVEVKWVEGYLKPHLDFFGIPAGHDDTLIVPRLHFNRCVAVQNVVEPHRHIDGESFKPHITEEIGIELIGSAGKLFVRVSEGFDVREGERPHAERHSVRRINPHDQDLRGGVERRSSRRALCNPRWLKPSESFDSRRCIWNLGPRVAKDTIVRWASQLGAQYRIVIMGERASSLDNPVGKGQDTIELDRDCPVVTFLHKEHEHY
jgi:hypothetical protein